MVLISYNISKAHYHQMDSGMNEMTFMVSSQTEDPVLMNHTMWSMKDNPHVKKCQKCSLQKR